MYSVVLVTCPDENVAQRISSLILDLRFAACVNILPKMGSMYWWEGGVQSTEEVLMLIKTRAELFDDLCDVVKENHPYKVPEIIRLDIDGGYQPYLDWVEQETKK